MNENCYFWVGYVEIYHYGLATSIFLERLHEHNLSCTAQAKLGFIPDILRIITKYNLNNFILGYITNCAFPSKHVWRAIVRDALRSREEQKLQVSAKDPKLFRFFQTYGTALHFHPIWSMEHNAVCYRKQLRKIAKLIGVLCDYNVKKNCVYCSKEFTDFLEHYICSCSKYKDTREFYWYLVLNKCSVHTSTYLYNLPDDLLVCVILGQQPNFNITEDELTQLMRINANVWQLLAHERELSTSYF